MIHGGTDISLNNLPLYVWSLMFGCDPSNLLFGSLTLGPWSKVFRFPLWSRNMGLEILNSALLLLVLHVYISNKEGNQTSQFPTGNFPKSGDLLLYRRRDLVDLRQQKQQRPSYRRRLSLLRAATFLGNILEAARWFKPVVLSAPPRLT
jgi:hypothetical protein